MIYLGKKHIMMDTYVHGSLMGRRWAIGGAAVE